MGITHRRAVMLLYGVSILLMVSAIAIALGRSWESGVALLVASVVLTGLIRFVGYFEYVRLRRSALTRDYDARTRRLRNLVPAFTADLARANTEGELWSQLVTFAAGAECAVMYLETRAGSVRRWPQGTTEPEAQGLIVTRFPLQPSGYVEFRFRGGEPLSAHSDILLQLAADAVDATLIRLVMPEAATTLIGLSPTPSGARTTGARTWLATR
jgi:UDP-GlcNAc:undecaprenyl-phosphate GlcNAc-1-phosphate transferase